MRSQAVFQILECQQQNCRFRINLAGNEKLIHCPLCKKELQCKKTFSHVGFSLPPYQHEAQHLVILLDNIRSALNVGAIFRTADGAGVCHVYLGGITATPDHPRLLKTALGAEKTVAWTKVVSLFPVIAKLKKEQYTLYALERNAQAISLYSFQHCSDKNKKALVIGNEKSGIDPDILDQCDTLISLPMLGKKQSLNVSVAAGIALYNLQFCT